jgi:lysyl-tRNA synthetase class II
MSSYIAGIADAISEAIADQAAASGGFSQEFTPVRVYIPERDYKDVTALTVHVFARAAERSRETRATIRKDVEVDIIVANKIDQLTDPTDEESNPQLDAMQQLVEEIADFAADNGPYFESPCLRVETDPIFDFEYLRSHRVFVGLIKVYCMRS